MKTKNPKGAGRKPTGVVRKDAYLAPEDWEYVRSLGESYSAGLRAAVAYHRSRKGKK